MASSPTNTKKRSCSSPEKSVNRRSSLPSTIRSSTIMTKEKIVASRSRRKSLVAARDNTTTKENRLNQYSPPETRSAKKRRTSYAKRQDDVVGASGCVLTFSPPDQKENARREKQELEKKERARDERVRNARKSGQLLVYDVDGYPLIGLPLSAGSAKKPPLPQVVSEAIQKRREQRAVENKALVQEVINLSNNKVAEDLKKEIEGLEAKIAVFQAESETSKDTLQCLAALQTSHEELKHQVTSLQEDKMSLHRQIENLECKLKEAYEKVAGQKIQLEGLLGAQGEAAALKFENQTLQTKLAEFEQKARNLEAVRIPELQILLNSEKDRAERYKTEMESLQSELDMQNEKIQCLTDEVHKHKSCQNEKYQSDQMCENQKCRIEQLEHDVYEHLRTIEANRNAISENAKSLKMAEDNFDVERKNLNDALEYALNRLHSLEQLNAELQKEVEESAPLISRVDALNKKIADEKSRLENTVVAKDQTIRQLEKKLRQATEDRDQARSNMQGRETELLCELREGELIRRQMHSRIMKLMGNIRVFVRVRPQLKHEGEGRPTVFSFLETCDGDQNADLAKSFLEIKAPHKDRGGLSDRQTAYRFSFDRVFGPTSTQEDVWEAVEPLIQCAVDGSAVTIFAYGQTGSGKTYTMLGDESSCEEGIVGRSIRMMFEKKVQIATLNRNDNIVTMSIEVLEVYNERVFDLLNKKDSTQNLKVTLDGVDGNKVVGVHSMDEILKILSFAQKRRSVEQTDLNESSSRSHLLFTINFTVGSNQRGKLNICDLAGSERTKKSGVQGQRLEESKNINTSLSALSNVIESLQTRNSGASFRNSKLTMLLKNSLTGDSKTLAFVCCSPLEENYDESLSCLRFAEKAGRVELKSVPVSSRKSVVM